MTTLPRLSCAFLQLSILSWSVFLHTGCVIESDPSIDLVLPEERECTSDEECVVIEDRCPCTAGGANTAVREDAIDAIDARRETILCPAEESQDPTCKATGANCVESVCELIGPPF
jgi:hypothetical protein